MKQPGAFTSRISQLGGFAGRFAFVVLVLVSFGLMLLGKADTALVERIRTTVADAVTPIMDVAARPATSVSGVISNIRELSGIREENSHLRDENERLRRWQVAARRLEAENDALKDLLNFVPEPSSTFVTGRVVADTGGAFAQSLLITIGRRDGVQKGQAVVSGDGLVGRIAEAGQRASRVLLVTDINSRIPVTVGNSRQRAILVGDNSPQPRLLFLKSAQAVAPGDRVMTSGDAGAFPPGLAVGIIASVADGDVRIEPYAQRERLDYVRAIDYGLAGIMSDVIAPKGADRSSER